MVSDGHVVFDAMIVLVLPNRLDVANVYPSVNKFGIEFFRNIVDFSDVQGSQVLIWRSHDEISGIDNKVMGKVEITVLRFGKEGSNGKDLS